MEVKPLSNKVNGLLKETGIIDVWRELHPKSHDYTHYMYKLEL